MISAKVIWLCVILYMTFLMSIALYITKKEGRSNSKKLLTTKVPWPVLIMTYVASLMSVWVFFSGPGVYYRGGLGYWLSELSYIAVFPIVAHFTMNKVWILNKMKKESLVTPADFYHERYKSPVLRVLLGCLFLITSFPYITSVLMAIGQAASFATNGEISYTASVIGIGCTMTVFMCIGGIKSAAIADTIQGLLFIGLLWGIVAICVIIGFQGSFEAAINVLAEDVPAFFSYPGPDGWTSYGNRFGYPFSCAIGWTIMLPHVFVRSGYFGDDLKAQRRLNLFAPVLQAIVWTGTMCIGLIGLALVQGLTAGDTELLIPYLINNIIYGESPVIEKGMMLAFFVGSCAVGISTANAFLGVSSAIISNDFIDKTLHIKVDESKKTLQTRGIIVMIGLTSILFALDPPELIYTLVMFAIAIVMPLFPILVCGIYWKKATKQAAITATIVGTILVLMTYGIWDLGNTYYGAIGMLGSLICMIVVSKCTTQDPQDSAEFFELLEMFEE